MNKKRIITAIILLVISILGISVLSANPIIGKWITGSARIVGSPINCEIMINNKMSHNAKLFKQEMNFDETVKQDYLILFIPNEKESEGRNVLVIDRKDSLIKMPNANRRDYEIIGNYLFQSLSGSKTMFPINHDIKGINFDPKLTFDDKSIHFTLPQWSEYKITTIHIDL